MKQKTTYENNPIVKQDYNIRVYPKREKGDYTYYEPIKYYIEDVNETIEKLKQLVKLHKNQKITVSWSGVYKNQNNNNQFFIDFLDVKELLNSKQVKRGL